MRGVVFFLVFTASLPLIFVSPFNGVLIWYVFSLGNFHTLVYGVFSDLYYAYIIAILTGVSWLFSHTDKKRLPLTPPVILTLIFSLWMTITSIFALAPEADVWAKWTFVQKVLFMALVGYALTTTRERVTQLIWVIVLSIGFWGVKGAIGGLLHGGARIQGPPGGAISDNNDFGLALIMVLPLLLYLWHFARNRWLRHGLILMGFLITVAAILTYSRGAFVGLCVMALILMIRSRAKLLTGILIIAVVSFIYNFAPEDADHGGGWFSRMGTIENYEQDGSAAGRIYLWKVALQIAEQRPFVGGGFRVTFWPEVTNRLLVGTNLPDLTKPRAVHSIYFDALSEHGYVGLALFLMITIYSWFNCSWLIRHSRDQPNLDWANLLGRMGHGVIVAYWIAGAFASQAYLDEYWCVVFLFDAARRIVARETASTVDAIPGASLVSVRGNSASLKLRARTARVRGSGQSVR
jgi:probable O-glycosylation ligase (exosortase A-associated)